MDRELTKVDVLQAGKILGILYACFAVISLPLVVLRAIGYSRAHSGEFSAAIAMVGKLLLYPVIGFVAGIILAAVYNLIAKWVGGLRFRVEESR